jgi:hypothetical protein
LLSKGGCIIQYTFEIYKDKGRWFFDDLSKDIIREEFVDNVPFLIKSLTRNDIIKVLVADKELVDYTTLIKFSRNGITGVYYFYKDIEMWFCPTFWKYFEKPAPLQIWIKII